MYELCLSSQKWDSFALVARHPLALKQNHKIIKIYPFRARSWRRVSCCYVVHFSALTTQPVDQTSKWGKWPSSSLNRLNFLSTRLPINFNPALILQIMLFAETVGKKTQFTSPNYNYKAHIQVMLGLVLSNGKDYFILFVSFQLIFLNNLNDIICSSTFAHKKSWYFYHIDIKRQSRCSLTESPLPNKPDQIYWTFHPIFQMIQVICKL